MVGILGRRAHEDIVAHARGAAPAECCGLLVGTGDGTVRLWGGTTSANTFALLGTHAMLGRALDPGDEANPNVVVLGFEAWQRLFHADASVVGRQLELRGGQRQLLTIVGVLPQGFEFPTGRPRGGPVAL